MSFWWKLLLTQNVCLIIKYKYSISVYIEAWNIYSNRYRILFLIPLTWLDFGPVGNTALYLKNTSKNERHLRLVTQNITKLSQKVCLINTYILMYWNSICNCKLWNALWFYCFFWVFSYIIDDHSCLNCCIYTKHSQIVYLISVHILIWQHPNCDFMLWKVICLNCVF